MKVIDTLPIIDLEQIINNPDEISMLGVFNGAIDTSDIYYDDCHNITLYYYLTHSGNKTVAPIYKTLYDLYKKKYPDYEEYQLIQETDFHIGRVIRSKFLDKWNKIYKVLVQEQYNPLNNRDFTETRTADNKNTITYNNTVTEDGNIGSKEVTTRDIDDNSNIYGFNSSVAVGDSTSTEISTETITGNYDENKSHSVRDKSGTDTTDFDRNETINLSGREDKSASSLITEELKLRDTKVFYDVICKDVDSILALQIYE